MAARPKRSTQVRLDRATADKLRDLAHDLGYVQTSGPLVGEGSTVKMLEAVVSGELQIVKTAPIDSRIDSSKRGDT